MTALEKFNEIKGLEKLQKHYPTSELKILEDVNHSKTMLIIKANYYGYHTFYYDLTFEFDESIADEVPPYITAFVGYDGYFYDARISIKEAEDIMNFLKEINKILGLED